MKRKMILLLVLFIISVAIIIFCALQYNELRMYEEGFKETGTYEYIAAPDDRHYIVLEKEGDNCKYYAYKQFSDLITGTYKSTDNPNLYVLKNDNADVFEYIIIQKDYAYYTKGEQSIKYDKISEGGIFINTGEPDTAD